MQSLVLLCQLQGLQTVVHLLLLTKDRLVSAAAAEKHLQQPQHLAQPAQHLQ
jgi:hypothetical protein